MGTSELPSELVRARSRFQIWRGQRRPGSRIPPSLWRLAVRLASSHGVSRTALALGVDYYSLKRRSEEASQDAPAAGPAFIELPVSPVVGKQCLLELDRSGARMRVQLVGYETTEIETLARALWNAD